MKFLPKELSNLPIELYRDNFQQGFQISYDQIMVLLAIYLETYKNTENNTNLDSDTNLLETSNTKFAYFNEK